MAVALLKLVLLRAWFMLPKSVRAQMLSQEDEAELVGKAREFKAVINVVAIYIQVHLIPISQNQNSSIIQHLTFATSPPPKHDP